MLRRRGAAVAAALASTTVGRRAASGVGAGTVESQWQQWGRLRRRVAQRQLQQQHHHQQARRSFFRSSEGSAGGGGGGGASASELQWRASRLGTNPEAHNGFMKELLRSDVAGAITAYEKGLVQQTPETLAAYLQALVAEGRLNGSRLAEVLHKGQMVEEVARRNASGAAGVAGGSELGNILGGFAASGARGAAGSASQAKGAAGGLFGGGAMGAAAGQLGSAEAPLYFTQAEPSLRSYVFRTMRFVLGGFLLYSALGAFVGLDEKGGAGGIATRLAGGKSDAVTPVTDINTRFKDCMGVEEAKGELEEVVHYLKDPEHFTKLGGKLPKGILLVGPPGTGKTLLARAVAGEAGVPFFYTSGSEFEEMFVGVGARRVRELFTAAKKNSPCIVFIDEIDAIGSSRNPKDQQYMRMTLNQMLVELDGFKKNEGIIVLAATNVPEALDKALVRPGRFDTQVVVPNPDVEGRRKILAVHAKKVIIGKNVDMQIIARGTPGFSGAELANLINVAALKAAMDGAKAVSMAHLEYAKDKILMGAERKSAVISEENRRLTAYHEGGHALVALNTDGAMPVHKATIVPRGQALGMVTQLPDKDQTSVSRRQMLARLDVCMGGRVAEEIIFGEKDVTSGASSDLKQATDLATAMVTRYGFSDKVGLASADRSSLSGEMRKLVDEEVKRMLNEAYERARGVLMKHEKELHKLANELLEKETLDAKQLKELVGSKA